MTLATTNPTLYSDICSAMTDAFVWVRRFAKVDLNQQGRTHLFLVVDAAHNLPNGIRGEFDEKTMRRDIQQLRELTTENQLHNDLFRKPCKEPSEPLPEYVFPVAFCTIVFAMGTLFGMALKYIPWA